MKGPGGKGIAEMAVAKQKGVGCETPTSEPGFSLTDRDYDFNDEMEVSLGCRLKLHLDPVCQLQGYSRPGLCFSFCFYSLYNV